MKHSALLLLPALLSTPALAQTTTDTFTGGTNLGGWTYGNPADFIDATGGNPGEHLHNPNVDTFAPQLRTTGSSAFTGDWRARDVTSFGVDLLTYSTQFPAQREATLLLTSGACSVFLLGTDVVPQPGAGWKSFDFAIDTTSAALPAGWEVFNGCGSDDATWNTVITDVTQVTLFYGNPTFFYIFDIWNMGADNPRITEGGGNYCAGTDNSTGQGAAMGMTGSTRIGADDLWLTAFPLPSNQFGIFFYGPEQDQVPFGNGFLCVGGGQTGLQRLDVEFSGTSGMLTHSLDYASPPTATGQIDAGSTWYFQAWYRDPAGGGANFNLSDGLCLTFTP